MTKLGKIILIALIIGAVIGTLAYTGNLDLQKFSDMLATNSATEGQSAQNQDGDTKIELRGELIYYSGEIYKERKDGWKQIKTGEILNESDIIKTNGDSRATILFDDGSIVRLGEYTEITFAGIKTDEIRTIIKSGSIYNRVAKAEGRNFITQYQDLETIALGTAYSMHLDNSELIVKVFESKVRVNFDNNQRELSSGEKLNINIDSKEVSREEIDLDKENKNPFFIWNKEEDEKNNYKLSNFNLEEEEADNQTEDDNERSTYISLSVKGYNASWDTDINAQEGFKLLWSPNPGPSYPLRSVDKYMYYKDSNARSGEIDAFNGARDYYVRVCEYKKGQCVKYSNEVKVYLEGSQSTAVKTGINSISLSLSGSSAGWSVDGYSPNGFKLLWSKNTNPTYPTRSADKYAYYDNPNARNGQIDLFDGPGEYFVRVCEYLNGQCGTYSNQVKIELGSSDGAESVKSISSTANGNKINWQVEGRSPHGFKIVWSKNSGATYPTRNGDKYIYLSSHEARTTNINAFNGPGTYYVRVCEYLGGACGVYSNEITTDL